jgi:hypothetical protein
MDLDSLVSDPSDNDTPAKEITFVTSWIEAFALYMYLMLTTYHPHRIADLLRYGLLIMRTAQMFPGLG